MKANTDLVGSSKRTDGVCHQSGLMHTVTGVSWPRGGKRDQPSKRERPMVLRKNGRNNWSPKSPVTGLGNQCPNI